jgi:hypothetical protein
LKGWREKRSLYYVWGGRERERERGGNGVGSRETLLGLDHPMPSPDVRKGSALVSDGDPMSSHDGVDRGREIGCVGCGELEPLLEDKNKRVPCEGGFWRLRPGMDALGGGKSWQRANLDISSDCPLADSGTTACKSPIQSGGARNFRDVGGVMREARPSYVLPSGTDTSWDVMPGRPPRAMGAGSPLSAKKRKSQCRPAGPTPTSGQHGAWADAFSRRGGGRGYCGWMIRGKL